MDVYLHALGCRLNEAELERWSRQLAAAGHRAVGRAEHAQVIVLNTCAVTAEAARKSRKLSGRLHRKNPAAQLVLTGCYATLSPERARELAGVDLVIDNRDKHRLVSLLDSELDPAVMPRAAQLPGGAHAHRHSRTRAFVKVQDGCRNRCSFCIVTIARGAERSRPVADVVSEVRQLEAEGYRDVVLSGVHLGGYGSELGTDLAALVRAVLAHTAVPRLRLSSLEPWDLPDDFFELWRDARLCPHLHLPLQSGSDAVLRRMARRCDAASYRQLVRRARAAIPDLVLTTDIIVGFPGESEAQWAETLRLCEEMQFAHVHIFSFSPREGTAAARMGSQIDVEIKRRRSRELSELVARTRQAQLRRFADTVRDVLWEGRPEPLDDGTLRWQGLTDNYLRVETTVGPHRELENRITPARLLDRGGERIYAQL